MGSGTLHTCEVNLKNAMQPPTAPIAPTQLTKLARSSGTGGMIALSTSSTEFTLAVSSSESISGWSSDATCAVPRPPRYSPLALNLSLSCGSADATFDPNVNRTRVVVRIWCPSIVLRACVLANEERMEEDMRLLSPYTDEM